MDCSPPGSSVHEILQARILEWVAMPFSRWFSWPRDWTCISCIAGIVFALWATREALLSNKSYPFIVWALQYNGGHARHKLAVGWCCELCDLEQVILPVGVSPFVRFVKVLWVNACKLFGSVPGIHKSQELYFYLYAKNQGYVICTYLKSIARRVLTNEIPHSHPRSVSRSVVSHCLRPHGLESAGLLCPWRMARILGWVVLSFSRGSSQPIHITTPKSRYGTLSPFRQIFVPFPS